MAHPLVLLVMITDGLIRGRGWQLSGMHAWRWEVEAVAARITPRSSSPRGDWRIGVLVDDQGPVPLGEYTLW